MKNLDKKPISVRLKRFWQNVAGEITFLKIRFWGRKPRIKKDENGYDYWDI